MKTVDPLHGVAAFAVGGGISTSASGHFDRHGTVERAAQPDRRRFDMAIRGTLDVGPNLIRRALGQSRLITCARADYPMRRGVPDQPGDLVGHDTPHFSDLRQGRMWTLCAPMSASMYP